MKKFYYAEGKEQKGPYTLEELKEHSISRETKVWCDGMANWEQAGTILLPFVRTEKLKKIVVVG